MATIFERLQALELSYDIKKISDAGEKVSSEFNKQEPHQKAYSRLKVDQVEPVGTVNVWAYGEYFTPMIDRILLEVYKPKRKRISRG
jgi:hypothetical protein